jgi:mRNA interferase MazF
MIVKKWGIYRANLDPVIGSEQGKSRPVVVISEDGINEALNAVNILPITSRKAGRNIYPNEVLLKADNHGLKNESIVLCHQIRTIDKQRFSKQFGEISDGNLKGEIITAICVQLGIEFI